jgi:hypothetical protein
MPVMTVSGRPQQIGNGSFVNSDSAAAQGRDEPATGRTQPLCKTLYKGSPDPQAPAWLRSGPTGVGGVSV